MSSRTLTAPVDLTATLLVDSKCALGEGIQWNTAKQRVFWTDIFGDVLLSCDENGEDFQQLPLEAGLCAFAFTTDGRILAGFTDGLYWLDGGTGARQLIKPYQPELPRTRMNDGGLDRQGRFIVGGIDEDGMHPITPIWSVSPDGITTLIEGVGCANSLVFSPDGTVMYFADTASTKIHAFTYDPATGQASDRRLFVNDTRGKPDGSCVDSEGALWNARFEGGCVIRVLPDGSDGGQITLPVPNVTCCCIGGADMNRMFITTARLAMSDADLAAKPMAGGLFMVDLPVTGLPHGTYKT